jgi:hypothetical protein
VTIEMDATELCPPNTHFPPSSVDSCRRPKALARAESPENIDQMALISVLIASHIIPVKSMSSFRFPVEPMPVKPFQYPFRTGHSDKYHEDAQKKSRSI